VTRGCADYFTRRFSSVFAVRAELLRFEYDSQLSNWIKCVCYTRVVGSAYANRTSTYIHTNGTRASPRVEWNRKRKTLKKTPLRARVYSTRHCCRHAVNNKGVFTDHGKGLYVAKDIVDRNTVYLLLVEYYEIWDNFPRVKRDRNI